MNPTDPVSGLQTFKSLLEYHLPELNADAATLVPAAVLGVAGLLLVFRGVFVVRALLGLVGAGIGGWCGQYAAAWLNSAPPITIALCALVGAIIVSSTYRLWLSAVTAALVFTAVCGYQAGRDAVNRILEPPPPAVSETPTLPTRLEQSDMLHRFEQTVRPYAESVAFRSREHLKQLPLRNLALPILAGLVALVVGWRAPRLAAGVWVGAIGSVLAIGAAAAALSAYSPEWRTKLTENPQYLWYAAAGVWLFGLLTQRSGMRRPRRAMMAEPAPAMPARRRGAA